MNSIFSHNSIVMILSSLLDKFMSNDAFISYFWNGIEYCAKL